MQQRILKELVDAPDEDRVVNILVRSCGVFGFDNSRYYDAVHCPIVGKPLFVLRASTREYPLAASGYRIEFPTFDPHDDNPRRVFFETSRDYLRRTNRGQWLHDLGLENHCWIDVPIFEDGELIGLWACDRAGDDPVTIVLEEEILAIADIAGTRLASIQRRRNAREISSMLDSASGALPDEITDHSGSIRPADETTQGPSAGSPPDETMAHSLASIAEALGARAAAFFRYDPSEGRLEKQVEMSFTSWTKKYEPVQGEPERYKVGNGITGFALRNKRFRFIPDIAGLRDGDSRSDVAQVLRSDPRIRVCGSVMYAPVEYFGAPSGVIRVLDRLGGSLLFTAAHREALDQLAIPFGQILSSVELTKRLESLWAMLSDSLSQVQNSGLQFRSIGQYVRSQGVSEGLVAVLGANGVITEAWGIGLADAGSVIGDLVGFKVEARSKAALIRVSDVPDAIAKYLAGADFAYVVVFRESAPRRATPETTVTYFGIRREGANADGDDKALKREKWRLHSLEVIGRLIGTIRELSRNRGLLYLAEEAIGTIGHEIRSPAASLDSLGTEVCEVGLTALSRAMSGEPIAASLFPFGEPCAPFRITNDAKEILQWLHEAQRRIQEHGQRINRVVQDAIRWARLGGVALEAHFSTLSIPRLLSECLDELRSELRAKPFLKIEVQETVRLLEPIVGDHFLLKILFTNLLDNAIKYSHRRDSGHRDAKSFGSTVIVRAERQPRLIDIFVTNWGLGIDRTDYENIFSSFYRSSVRDRLHTIRGVGLGLPTCRKIVMVHNGSIRVDSVFTLEDPERFKAKEGFQTTFVVRLPLDLKPGRVDIDMTRINQRRRGVV